jgi:hypothetical protein
MSARLFIPIALCLVWAGSAQAQYSVGVSAVIVDRVEASAPQVELTREGNVLLVGSGDAERPARVLLEATWLAPVTEDAGRIEAVATWRQADRASGWMALQTVVPGSAGPVPDGGWVSVPGGVSGAALPTGTGSMVVTRVIASNS